MTRARPEARTISFPIKWAAALALCTFAAACGTDDAPEADAPPAPRTDTASVPTPPPGLADTAAGGSDSLPGGSDTLPPPATDPAAAAPGVELTTLLERVHDRTLEGELAVLEEMHPPLESTVEAVENRHQPGVIDTLRTLHYGGLDVEIYEAAERGMIQTIRVDGSHYETGLGFSVGASRPEVREAIGPHLATLEDGTLVWEQTEAGPVPPRIEVAFDEQGEVTSITWRFYVD